MSQIAKHAASRRTFTVKRADASPAEIVALEASPASDVRRLGTVLAVPGYTGSKEDFTDLLDPLAAAGFGVVAIDQPGQYESPGLADRADYRTESLGAVVADLAEILVADGESVHLLGHSFGGLVARAAAITRPEAFCSVTLLGSGPSAIGGARADRMAVLEPILLNAGMAAAYDKLAALAAADPRRADDPAELKEFLRKRWLASSAVALLGMGDALMTEPDRVAELAATELPILVCCGENDDAWLPRTQREMATRLNAIFVEIPGAYHSPPSEAPVATITTLLNFWRPLTPQTD